MEYLLRTRLYLYSLGLWLLRAARLLLWCLMTGSLAMGTAWTGRPAVLTDWLAAGPPTWRRTGRQQIMIALEAARGVAAMESWIRAGCPSAADRPERDRTERPNTSD